MVFCQPRAYTKKQSHYPGDGLLCRRAKLESTIGADWLNFFVRNGNRCDPVA